MSKKAPLNNASEVIERFGGIRPMATKIGVAVTTVQGWKKRDAIPGNRYDSIMAAATEHSVDLSGVWDDDIADEVVAEIEAVKAQSAPAPEPEPEPEFKAEMNAAEQEPIPPSFIASMLHDDIIQLIARSERRAVMKSTWTSIFLIILTVGAIGVLMWPQAEKLGVVDRAAEMERLEALQNEIDSLKEDVDGVKNKQGFFGRVVPDDLTDRLNDLQQKAEDARAGAMSAVDEMRAISTDVLDGRTQALQQRMGALESKLGTLTDVPLMAGLSQRYQAFAATAGGQDLLGATTGELSNILGGLGGQDEATVNAALEEARAQDPALAESFDGVPQDDLKAAALLLTMTQLRSTLNRPGESFAEDLGLLRNLVGEDNLALSQSIEKLAPHADAGILTPAGLSDELKTLTGEIVVASLKGEEVGIKDRAKARLNNLLQVEKDGELVTGTETQAAVVQAQNALGSGDLASAIAQIQSLDGPSAAVVGPWLQKAQAAMAAGDLKQTLSGVLSSSAAGLSGIGSFGPSELLVDPISGTRVLRRGVGAGGLGGDALKNLPSLPDLQ